MDSATLSLLRESVVSFLNMSDPSQQCPSVWQEITTPHRVCGRRSTLSPRCEGLNYTTGSEQYDQVCGRRSTLSPSCEGLTYSTGSEQYDQVCGRIIGYQLGSPDAFDGPTLSILMELVSHMALPASTSGVLLLVSMKGGTFLNQRAPVLLKALMTTLSLRLWARTTSVNQA